ncbi:DUF3231 family protein [Alicyclobacillus fastidiosus]|uniref:DUF3231 family protein n=1 Tax=Alicyclobacillus fastidiosus TaxID=392011 RepID=A0ABY6ZK88_9BACL|nr:DUF3231 family protein [Alicyclobacillus fastidiosus]WAH43348.1 DUF3231 family protein [Alicyclobacillus fastidiosus]GMA65407.1 hypothetical protein GCM10025859_58470 [Alicyclobacillus fastidiosus]
MGILSGNPKDEPMHYGEVYGLWAFLLILKGLYSMYQIYVNHAGDTDLRKFVEDILKSIHEHSEQVTEVLKENGVGLPPSPPDQPKVALESIPAGARIIDPQIAANLTADVAGCLVACSQIMGSSIREDIAVMFGKVHISFAQYGIRLLRIVKAKGWLVAPPLHRNPPR